MLATKILALPGSPASSVASALWYCCRKALTEVMVDGEDVQTSLAPIRIVTYWAPWATAFDACAGALLILAPDTESLYACPVMAPLRARMRS